ncbi:uncharacterized protein F4822DRAFT_198186 [Hypoxylon trugodes]|uniref:uncharacterized protein n=1 Tax=Hypoxylon trugodes TaxID=326681 RepID=UPI0021930FFF|nr:uncharacterized protein F4822DRAFT_198186 [Hypoxylon trugodes]KAI1389348.1 hypothetical protein F4822DRAFT_198186 [Hypoxylon trugodes]
MTTFLTPEELESPNHGPKESVKYRTSCDRCQNIKLRCSQEKPACKRCAKKGLRCIYSPLRRMGRPRKAGQAAPIIAGLDENSVTSETSASITQSSNLSDSRQERAHTNLSDTLSQPTDYVSPADGRSGQQRHVLEPWSSETNLRNTHKFVSESITGGVSNSTDCYTAIITRTAKLEQSLIDAPRPPPIDLVLEAERDLRTLMQCVSTCNGHEYNGRQCLVSDRPVLLSLSLLTERIVTMLEETFRFAAATANTENGSIQDPCRDLVSTVATRRIERAFRGLLDQPCVFPIPAGNLDLRVGNYVVDKPVKARAIKGILQVRMRKLLRTLEDMKTIPRAEDRRDSLIGPLNWGNSASVIEDAAQRIVQDLIRRMEALEGGMALMR